MPTGGPPAIPGGNGGIALPGGRQGDPARRLAFCP